MNDKQIQALAQAVALAVVTALTEGETAVPTKPQPKADRKDGRNKAARQHNHDARIARRQDPTRKGGAGMTKAERRDLAAELRSQGKDPSNARTWNAACKKARGL